MQMDEATRAARWAVLPAGRSRPWSLAHLRHDLPQQPNSAREWALRVAPADSEATGSQNKEQCHVQVSA